MSLAERQPAGWTLIGAQMVALHGFEHGRTPPRSSRDADILINVRVVPQGTRQFARLLQTAGFELDPPDLDDFGHRFRNDRVILDVLAPDGLGERADLTLIPPVRTVPVPGGSLALRRSEMVDVELGERRGHIPRPDLLGAVLVKARAVKVDDVPDAQRLDLAFLLTLMQSPRQLAEQLKDSERGWLEGCAELMDLQHPAWFQVEEAEIGQRAFRVLLGSARI
jgi:hypothetical protein